MAAQGEFDGGFEEAEFVAGIVALAVEFEGINRTAAEQVAQGVGQLDLSARSSFDALDGFEDIGRQNVAADDGEIRGRVGGVGLFDEIPDAIDLISLLPFCGETGSASMQP